MTTTPNMGLTIPETLVTTGPQYANQINTAFDEVDAHDHTPGKGVRITPSGLNINASLPMNNQSLINTKSIVLALQTSVTTNRAIYSRGVDLYYRDASGNEVRITAAGALDVSGVGGFTGLAAPASASYVAASEIFAFYSDAAEFAKLGTGDLSIYPRTGASPQAVTLVADVSTAAYNLHLPAIAPAANTFMRLQSGAAGDFVELLGTNNQVTVTHNAADVTLSLPQDIHTGATPTFAGETLTGLLTGVDALFSSDVELQGDLNLTKASPAVIDAPTYDATFLNVITDTITPRTGTVTSTSNDLTVGNDLVVTNDLSCVDASVTGDLTISNNVTMSGVLKTFNANLVTANFGTVNTGNIGASSAIFSGGVSALSLTATSFLSTPDIQTATITSNTGTAGIYIQGRLNGVSPASQAVGEIQLYAPASNITCSASFQNLTTQTLGAGIWEVSGCVAIVSTASGGSSPGVRFLQGAVSLSSGATDDVRYANTAAANGIVLSSGEQMDVITFSRRLNLSSTTSVYLVGKLIASNVSNAQFEAARTTLKIQRVA